MRSGEREFFGRTIDVSSTDKLFYPDDGVTKGDLVAYYARIAETMSPHVDGRPVALKRHPDGIGQHGFFQKNAGPHFPDWITRRDIRKREGGTLDHVVIDEPATIVYLADQGTIEFHGWLSTADDLEHPDDLIFDLDPPGDDDPAAVRTAARHVHDVLDELGLPSRVKTSGSTGFHVHVPLDRSADFDTARAVAADIARLAVARHPDELTVAQRVGERGGRVFVDYLRNAYGQTSVAPYSLRARPGAPIATPIDWDELGTTAPRTYTLRNLFRRLGQREDPWAARPARTDLDGARATLGELLGGAG